MTGLFDRIAEATVALSFASTGYHLREGSWDPGDLGVDLSGAVVVITGANSGIGFEAASFLAGRGARVMMVCRSSDRGEAAAARIRAERPEANIEVLRCDVSELDDVRALAAEINRKTPRVDRLILNAGVLLNTREQTASGLERTFATNVLGGFLLARLLEPAMKAAGSARLLHVTSGGMYTQHIDLDALQGKTARYDGVLAYAQTKRAQVILNELWAERLAPMGAVSHAMHPGWADTPGLAASLPRFHKWTRPFLRDAAQGADTLIWLALAPSVGASSGELWLDRAPRATHKLKRTRETEAERKALWALCEELTA